KNDGRQLARLERAPQELPRPEQVPLPDQLGQRPRPHPLGQRLPPPVLARRPCEEVHLDSLARTPSASAATKAKASCAIASAPPHAAPMFFDDAKFRSEERR